MHQCIQMLTAFRFMWIIKQSLKLYEPTMDTANNNFSLPITLFLKPWGNLNQNAKYHGKNMTSYNEIDFMR